jgi:hypothetical protein
VNSSRGKGRAVVTADRVGEAVLSKQSQESAFDASGLHIRQAMATEQVAAEVVDDGERVAVSTVAHEEFAFEIHGPDLIRSGGVEGRSSWMLPASVASPRTDAAVTFKNIEDRASCGPVQARKTLLEPLQDFSCAPSVSTVFCENVLNELVRSLMRARLWCTTAVVESTDSALAETVEPLVAGDPADAIAQAKLRHRPVATLEVLNKLVSFEHWIGLHPWHSTSLRIELGGSVSHVPGHL